MTTPELLALAKRSALVQWSPSGVVEYLYTGRRTGHVYAQNILTKRFHRILTTGRVAWYCREILPHELVSLGNLLPVSRRKSL